MNSDYYENVKKETLSKIKSMRFAKAQRPEIVSYNLNSANKLFDYEDEGYASYKFLIDQVNDLSFGSVKRIVLDNLRDRNINIQLVQIRTQVIPHNGKNMVIPEPFLSFVKSCKW